MVHLFILFLESVTRIVTIKLIQSNYEEGRLHFQGVNFQKRKVKLYAFFLAASHRIVTREKNSKTIKYNKKKKTNNTNNNKSKIS